MTTSVPQNHDSSEKNYDDASSRSDETVKVSNRYKKPVKSITELRGGFSLRDIDTEGFQTHKIDSCLQNLQDFLAKKHSLNYIFGIIFVSYQQKGFLRHLGVKVTQHIANFYNFIFDGKECIHPVVFGSLLGLFSRFTDCEFASRRVILKLQALNKSATQANVLIGTSVPGEGCTTNEATDEPALVTTVPSAELPAPVTNVDSRVVVIDGWLQALQASLPEGQSLKYIYGLLFVSYQNEDFLQILGLDAPQYILGLYTVKVDGNELVSVKVDGNELVSASVARALLGLFSPHTDFELAAGRVLLRLSELTEEILYTPWENKACK